MSPDESLLRLKTLLSRSDAVSRLVSVGLLIVFIVCLEKMLPLVALFDDGWAVWWPTNGITLALLLISRRRHWPFIFLATTIATTMGQPLGEGSLAETLSIATANGFEVLVAAWMLPRFYTLNGWLQERRLVWSFVLYAVILAPALSSLFIGSFYALAQHRPFVSIAVRWGVSDVVGIVMFTPLVLALISPQLYALFQPRKLPSTLGVLSLLLLTSWLVFYHSSLPVAFLISPVMLLVASRCGFSGSVLAINLLAPIATAATLHGNGPFSLISSQHEMYRILAVQVFLILSMLMSFPLAVARVQQHSTSAQLRKACAQMEALATADFLTGLANRRRFDAALEEECRRGLREGLPVSVLMLDADNFKAYNDRYGHPAGDLCLQSIARAIADIPRRAGDLVARYGGEEFVILLPGVDGEGAHVIAEQVRYNVAMLNLPHLDSATGRVTISVGCACNVPPEDRDAALLLEGSDRALYSAKRAGRNRSVLYRWGLAEAGATSRPVEQAMAGP